MTVLVWRCANNVEVRIGIGHSDSEIDFAGSEDWEGLKVDSIKPSNFENDVYLFPKDSSRKWRRCTFLQSLRFSLPPLRSSKVSRHFNSSQSRQRSVRRGVWKHISRGELTFVQCSVVDNKEFVSS